MSSNREVMDLILWVALQYWVYCIFDHSMDLWGWRCCNCGVWLNIASHTSQKAGLSFNSINHLVWAGF